MCLDHTCAFANLVINISAIKTKVSFQYENLFYTEKLFKRPVEGLQVHIIVSVSTYNSVAKLPDPTRERGGAGSLSGDHSAVFSGEDGRANAVLYQVPRFRRPVFCVPMVLITALFPNEIA